jgi:hypothetical protein
MLNWIQFTVANERELLETLLRGCHRLAENIPAQMRNVLSAISEALCQPLRVETGKLEIDILIHFCSSALSKPLRRSQIQLYSIGCPIYYCILQRTTGLNVIF